jgi:hypothetical protein
VKAPTPIEASTTIEQWFLESGEMTKNDWQNDQKVLTWMADHHAELEKKVLTYTKECVVQEVMQVMTAGGNTARVGASGIVEGLAKACESMGSSEREEFKKMLTEALLL